MKRPLQCIAAPIAAVSLAACGGLFESDAAAGGTSAAGSIPSFDKLDANDDGYVSLPESGVDTRISRNFNAADRDGDYRLNRDEYRAAARKVP